MSPDVRVCRCGASYGIAVGEPVHTVCPACRVELTCLGCSERFYADRDDSPLCPECRKESLPTDRRDKPRTCPACGREFVLKKWEPQQTRYCTACRDTRAPSFDLGLICEACGKPIPDRDRHGMLRRHRRFCSPACKYAARHGKPAWNRGQRKHPSHPCEVCGKPIRHPRQRRCSLACFHATNPFKDNGGSIYRGEHREDDDPPAPDLEEIARLCAEIRAGWSEKERQQRLRYDWRPQRWWLGMIGTVAELALADERSEGVAKPTSASEVVENAPA